jgi:hypothetical protein
MRSVHVDKLALQSVGTDPEEARLMARRVAELLGEGLAGGQAVRPVREAIVDVQVPPGISGDMLAEFVAREIRRQLG